MEKTRILLIYKDLSTVELEPIQQKLRGKYGADDLPIYHVQATDAKAFLADGENGEFSFIFFEIQYKKIRYVSCR